MGLSFITLKKRPRLLTTKTIAANDVSKRRYANGEIQEKKFKNWAQ